VAPAAWTKARLAAFVLFVVAVFSSLFVLVHPWDDLTVDGSIYLLTARSLLAGEGYTYLGEPFLVRPPGFSVLLAPLLAVVGTDFFALNFFVALFGAAGVVLLFFFERARLGFWLALLVALAVWLNPDYERLSTQIMSDVPGVTLLLVCLLVERWARAKPSWRRELVLGLCIGLSAYVRALLVLLVPAIALSRLLLRSRERDPSWPSFVARRLLLFTAVALLVLAPWSIRNRLQASAEPVEQTWLHSYGVALLHVDPADPSSPLLGPAEILGRIPLRSRLLASVLGSRMQKEYKGAYEPEGAFLPGHAALALCMLAASLVVLWRRREPAEIFVFGLLAVIVTYFTFGSRLVLPVYVLGFPALVEVVRDLAARLAGGRVGGAVAAAMVLGLIALDFEPRRDWNEIEREHRATVELSRAIASAVSPNERLGAPTGAHYSVFLERPVYNLTRAALQANSLEAAERVIEKHQLDAVVFSNLTMYDQAFAQYFRSRHGPPERVGPALIWRIPHR